MLKKIAKSLWASLRGLLCCCKCSPDVGLVSKDNTPDPKIGLNAPSDVPSTNEERGDSVSNIAVGDLNDVTISSRYAPALAILPNETNSYLPVHHDMEIQPDGPIWKGQQTQSSSDRAEVDETTSTNLSTVVRGTGATTEHESVVQPDNVPSTVDQKVGNPQDIPDIQVSSEQGQEDVARGSYQGPVVENDLKSQLITANRGALDADNVGSTRSRADPKTQPRRKVDLEPRKERLTGDHDSMLAAEQETPGSPHSAEQEQGDVGGTPGVVVDKGSTLSGDKTRRPQKQPRRGKPVGPNPDSKKEAVS